MTKTILMGIVLISLGAIVFVRGREPKPAAIEYSDPDSQMLEVIRKKYDFPALAVAVVKEEKICDRAAVIPFLQSVASGQEGDITSQVLADALADTRPSVTAEQLRRFDEWGRTAARA